MRTTAKERAEVLDRLIKLGVSYADACTLRRIAMTLHRWFELECGDSNDYASWVIVRGTKAGKVFTHSEDGTGQPYLERHYHDRLAPSYTRTYTRIPDKETRARTRLAKIMTHYPQCHAYTQTDPRGASLYLVPQSTLDLYKMPIEQVYNHGVAVY